MMTRVPRRPCCSGSIGTDQVVSFHSEEGFDPVAFPDHDAMLAYVFQKTSNGFRIQ